MIPVEHFNASLTLTAILSFTSGTLFGVWLTIRIFSRAPKQFRANQWGNFEPTAGDGNPDPTKPPPFHIGGSVGEKSPMKVETTIEHIARDIREGRFPEKSDTFERDPIEGGKAPS